MRLTILFLFALGVTLATNDAITDISGVWVAVIDQLRLWNRTPANAAILGSYKKWRPPEGDRSFQRRRCGSRRATLLSGAWCAVGEVSFWERQDQWENGSSGIV